MTNRELRFNVAGLLWVIMALVAIAYMAGCADLSRAELLRAEADHAQAQASLIQARAQADTLATLADAATGQNVLIAAVAVVALIAALAVVMMAFGREAQRHQQQPRPTMPSADYVQINGPRGLVIWVWRPPDMDVMEFDQSMVPLRERMARALITGGEQ